MTPLLLLAEKVEGLSGLDRGIDKEIAHAIGDAQMRDGTLYAWCEAGSTTERVRAALYTSSVDTAMRLVPEGWYWSIKQYPRVGCVADIGGIHTGKAHTPALALVAASLRARAAMEAGE